MSDTQTIALKTPVDGCKYEEVRADQLRAGDYVLCRYFDVDGMYVEENWLVAQIQQKRYGKGARYLIWWCGANNPDSYSARALLGRAIGAVAA